MPAFAEKKKKDSLFVILGRPLSRDVFHETSGHPTFLPPTLTFRGRLQEELILQIRARQKVGHTVYC